MSGPTDWIPPYIRPNIHLEHIMRKSHFYVELSNAFMHEPKVQHLIKPTEHLQIIKKNSMLRYAHLDVNLARKKIMEL